MTKNTNLKSLSIAVILCTFFHLPVKAETIFLEDFDYSIVGIPSGVGFVSARWGTWNGSVFTEAQFGVRSGVFNVTTGDDGVASLNQVDQASGGYTPLAANTQLALAIFSPGVMGVTGAQASLLSYSSANAVYQVILQDSSWKVPSSGFANNATIVPVFFTASTQAVGGGSFSYNSGVETITMIPEPSTGALMMIGAVGLVALRRLRKV